MLPSRCSGAGGAALANARRYAFGGDSADVVVGGTNTDRLYGGDSSDYLIGKGGNDYIEGGRGLDVYEYPNSAIQKIEL